MNTLFKQLEICRKARVNLAIWGRHGVGKTARINAYARAINGRAVTLVLSQVDAVTLGGYPYKVALEDGSMVQRYAIPDWILELRAAADAGLIPILFLDEFNRADKFSHNAAMTLVLDRKINGHALPADTLVVCAMNPESDDDMGVNELTAPMIDRFCHIALHSDPNDWLDWADKAGVNPLVTGFIRQRKDALTAFHLNFADAIGRQVLPTDRSWDAVGRILTAAENDLDGNTVLPLIAGLVGNEAALGFNEFVKNNSEPEFTYAEITKPTKKVLDRVARLRTENKVEVLTASLQSFHKESNKKFAGVAGEEIGKEISKGVAKFLLACPADVVCAFFALTHEDRNIWSDPQVVLPFPEELIDILAVGV